MLRLRMALMTICILLYCFTAITMKISVQSLYFLLLMPAPCYKHIQTLKITISMVEFTIASCELKELCKDLVLLGLTKFSYAKKICDLGAQNQS